MSDSSSEDDIPVQLLESVDKGFLNDSLFCENKKKDSSCKNDEQSLLPSLRPKDDEHNAFTETGVTKSCQTYIGKQLTKLLDKKLEKLITQKNENIIKSNNKVESGVLLFSDSVAYLSACDELEPVVKKRKLNCEANNTLEKRCKTVAVSADWILSGTATKGWCKNTKGDVIHVKRLNSEESNVIEYELIK